MVYDFLSTEEGGERKGEDEGERRARGGEGGLSEGILLGEEGREEGEGRRRRQGRKEGARTTFVNAGCWGKVEGGGREGKGG